jgi:hypothetical protein
MSRKVLVVTSRLLALSALATLLATPVQAQTVDELVTYRPDNRTGSAAAALCPRGSFSATTGASQCTPAAVGYYVPDPGSTQQLACASAVQTGLSVCTVQAPSPTPATPDTDGPATEDTPLPPQGDECPPGTWSTTGTAPAGSSCTPASPGTFVAGSGATAEVSCPPGTFSDGFGASVCTPAPVGTFVAGPGAMDPLPCPGATEPGLTSCPEDLSATTAVVADAPASRSMWWWSAGLAFVLAAGGGAFLLLQRRTGALVTWQDGSGRDLSGTGAAHLAGLDTDVQEAVVDRIGQPPSSSAASVDVIEWDEAIDGVLDDGPEPPPSP